MVFVVDDDVSVREALEGLIKSAGWRVGTFASAQEFLSHSRTDAPSCLVLDIAMPGMSGTDLWQELTKRRQVIPIVFITASGDRSIRRRVIAEGAVECLFKPFSGTALREALHAALRLR